MTDARPLSSSTPMLPAQIHWNSFSPKGRSQTLGGDGSGHKRDCQPYQRWPPACPACSSASGRPGSACNINNLTAISLTLPTPTASRGPPMGRPGTKPHAAQALNGQQPGRGYGDPTPSPYRKRPSQKRAKPVDSLGKLKSVCKVGNEECCCLPDFEVFEALHLTFLLFFPQFFGKP